MIGQSSSERRSTSSHYRLRKEYAAVVRWNLSRCRLIVALTEDRARKVALGY